MAAPERDGAGGDVGGAHWVVCVSDSGIPLFSWAEGMPVPARVLWNIVTGVATAATNAGYTLRRIGCDRAALIVSSCGPSSNYVMAALFSMPASMLASCCGPQPADVTRMYGLLTMMAGANALAMRRVDRVKAVARVACRPLVVSMGKLRRGDGGRLARPLFRLLSNTDALAALCAKFASVLGTACVALLAHGALCATSKAWASQLHSADASTLVAVVLSLPPAAMHDVPVYLPWSRLGSDDEPGKTRYRLVVVNLAPEVYLLALATTGNPTLVTASRKVRDVLASPGPVRALRTCITPAADDHSTVLASLHPCLVGVVVHANSSSGALQRQYEWFRHHNDSAAQAWLRQYTASLPHLAAITDSYVRGKGFVAFAAFRSRHVVAVLLQRQPAAKLPSLLQCESIAVQALEACTAASGLLSPFRAVHE